jgi:imidazolonepropionase-like amidohydrolase
MLRVCILSSLLSFASLAAETIAITNAHIYTMGKLGEIQSGTVVIENGKIRDVGARAQIPAGARVIDAKKAIVTPGFILTGTGLGAEEIPGVPSTIQSGVTAGHLSSGFDIQYSINPDSSMLPIARLGGNTSCIATPRYLPLANPTDRLFAGNAALISLASDPNLVLKPKVAMAIPSAPGGPGANGDNPRGTFFVRLKEQLNEARAFARNREAYNQNRLRTLSLKLEDLEALIPVIDGREPLLVDIDSAAEIRQLLALARTEKIRLILSSVSEGWRVADELAQSHTPVIIDAWEDLPNSFSSLASTLENAARLHEAKVSVSILSPSIQTGSKTSRLAAGRAVSYGLPWQEALAALTINPAKAFGIADQTGSLEHGKRADLVVWNGDPLDTSGYVEMMFIAGQEQPLKSRQTQLRDRYMAPVKGYPAQYRQ